MLTLDVIEKMVAVGYVRRIAGELNSDRVPTKRRGKWLTQSVKDVLDNLLHYEAA